MGMRYFLHGLWDMFRRMCALPGFGFMVFFMALNLLMWNDFQRELYVAEINRKEASIRHKAWTMAEKRLLNLLERFPPQLKDLTIQQERMIHEHDEIIEQLEEVLVRMSVDHIRDGLR